VLYPTFLNDTPQETDGVVLLEYCGNRIKISCPQGRLSDNDIVKTYLNYLSEKLLEIL
jgi:hypothetical protein